MISKILKFKWYLLIGTLMFLFLYSSIIHIEPNEIGISRNFLSGHMEKLNAGWKFKPFWIGVSVVDTRPLRVLIGTTGKGYSAKLIQFDSEYWEEFVNNEGWRYYWWDNRLSLNLGFNFEESRGLNNILRGYAYGKKKYNFLKVLEEF